ncbi:uncharacterized protein [Penaeus vannamei]|uniref:uncharacterized protein n=1 Tax=Penaeus vannamei TaxID=6689 RepID=UPI00387FA4D7
MLRRQRPKKSRFTLGKSTVDRILALQVIVEHCRDFGHGLLAAYIEEVLETGGLLSFFPARRQGCVIAPTLLNICMYWILGRATFQGYCGATLGSMKVTDLDSADDVAILYASLETLVVALGAFSIEVKPMGLEVSWTKTKIHDFGDLLGEPVQKSVDEQGCQYMHRRTKLRVLKALIMPVLLYCSETWTLSSALESCLDAIRNRSLCRIMGYSWRDQVFNQRLHRETGTGPTICAIRNRQLRLYGHLAHFPKEDPANQVVSVQLYASVGVSSE